MKHLKYILMLLLLAGLTVMVLAQNTQQSENECFEGGFLEGQCSTTDVDGDGDVDQNDIDWMYTCGAYLSFVDDALIISNDQIPLEGCRWPERVIPRPEDPAKEKAEVVVTEEPMETEEPTLEPSEVPE